MKCKTCKHWFDNGTDLCSCDRDALLREADFFCAAWEQKPVEEVYTVREKPTNADKIRSLSDEGLENWIENLMDSAFCPSTEMQEKCARTKCDGCWLAWLKSPAEKDGAP